MPNLFEHCRDEGKNSQQPVGVVDGCACLQIRSVRTGGPQPGGGGGPQFVAEHACTPQAAARIGISAQAGPVSLFNFES